LRRRAIANPYPAPIVVVIIVNKMAIGDSRGSAVTTNTTAVKAARIGDGKSGQNRSGGFAIMEINSSVKIPAVYRAIGRPVFGPNGDGLAFAVPI